MAVGNTIIAAGGRANVDDLARQRGEARRRRATTATAATSATATSATAASATSTTSTSASATASATAASTTSTAATASTASATSAAATSATTSAEPLPRTAGNRAEARCRQAADPQGQLPRRQGAPRSHEASAARPGHRAEPEAGRRQACGFRVNLLVGRG